MPDEPGVGLEQVRMTPLDKSAPVPRGAGASPGALHDSGPTPASIARVSRDSITMRSVEARGGFLVFRRFNGLLLRRPLRRGHIPPLGIHLRKGFHFRQGIGSRWDFHRRRRGIESAWQPRERALPRVMGERRRGSGLPMATKTADQVFGEFPIARRPARLLTLPRPAPWPRSPPGRQRACGARRRPVQPPLAGSPRPPSGTPIARLGRTSLQLLRRQRGQGGKLLRLLLRPPEGRYVSGCYHKGLRKPLQIPPHPFF